MASPSFAIESTVPQEEDLWIRQSPRILRMPLVQTGLEPLHEGLSHLGDWFAWMCLAWLLVVTIGALRQRHTIL